MSKVRIQTFDTTLRDGAQSLPEANQFPIRSKPDIADEIASLGISVIEAGFPRTPGDFEEVKSVARSVGRYSYEVANWDSVHSESRSRIQTPVIAGLSRTVPSDIETTWNAVKDADFPRIHTFISTDPEHMAAKFPDKSPSQVMEMGRHAVALARQFSDEHGRASVEFSAEAASTTDMDYLEKVVKTAVAEGADVINVPDTVGQRDPFWMYGFYRQVIEWVTTENPETVVSAHNHNDIGLAAANTLSLVRAAANFANITDTKVNIQAESTICGLGERAGNADIFTFMGSLFKFSGDMAAPVSWDFNPSRSVEVARNVMKFADMEVHRQAPIVGEDTNVHRSGIHSDGILKGGFQIYTPHDPRFWGHSSDAIHQDGRYQGKRGRSAT